MDQQPAEVDGAPMVEPVPVVAPEPLVEAWPVKPGLPTEFDVVPVWPVPAVALGSPLLPLGGVPLAIEPQGRPIASVRPVLFSELVVPGGLVLMVPGVDGVMPVVPGVGVDGAVVLPPMPVVPLLVPVEPPLDPDDAPPPPAAIAKPALPARRIAAINDTARRVRGIANS